MSIWMLLVVSYFSLKPNRNLLAVAGISAIILYFTRIEEEAFATCQSTKVKSVFLAVIQVSSVLTFLISLAIWFLKDRVYIPVGISGNKPKEEKEEIIEEEIIQNESISLLKSETKKNLVDSFEGNQYLPY